MTPLRRVSSLKELKTKSFENLRRIATETSLTIPDNFSFASIKIETYRIRWALLALCGLCTCISYMQWIQFSIVANIIMEYYNVSYVTVDWMSLIFMVTYVILSIPISYYMDVRVSFITFPFSLWFSVCVCHKSLMVGFWWFYTGTSQVSTGWINWNKHWSMDKSVFPEWKPIFVCVPGTNCSCCVTNFYPYSSRSIGIRVV